MDVLQLLSELGIFGMLVAGIAWVFRSLGKQYIDRRFAAYQNELDKTSQQYRLSLDRDLEKYRSELNLEYLKHSRIHERRLEVISQLYRLLVLMDKSMNQLTALIRVGTGEDWDDRRQREMEEAINAYNSFLDYFSENRILLSQETCSLIEELKEEYHKSYRLSTFNDRFKSFGDSERAFQMTDEAYDKIRDQVPPLRQKLEDEFRKQLDALIVK